MNLFFKCVLPKLGVTQLNFNRLIQLESHLKGYLLLSMENVEPIFATV
ncbi:hypothetical protein CCP3SC5AM1_170008 [Gammaproteobacteria bacterium]